MPPNDSDSQSPIFWERLRNLFVPREEEAGREGDVPRQRGITITACVLISFTLWLTFTLQERKSVRLSLPTQVVNLPADQALEARPPDAVNVLAEGEGLQLLWLYYNPPAVPIDASREAVRVQEALNLPDNVRVVNVSPQQIQVEVGSRITRRVPVRSRVTLQPGSAHELLGTPAIRPDSIEVSGAERIVASLRYWPTDSTRIEGLTDTLTTRVPLADTLAGLVQRSRSFVSLTAQAGEFAEDSRQINVQVTGVPSDQNVVALEPSTIRVRYRVLFDQLFEAQRAPDFFATVSYDQIRRDTTGFVRPELNLPDDLIIRDPERIPPRLRYYTYVSND